MQPLPGPGGCRRLGSLERFAGSGIDLTGASPQSAPATADSTGEAWRGGLALVIGARGGLGAALCTRLRSQSNFHRVLSAGRRSAAVDSTHAALDLDIDLTDEPRIAAAAASIGQLIDPDRPLRLVIDATGFLHGGGHEPEKSWRQLDAAHMAHAFAINAIGPALLMKHFLPLLPRSGKAVFATLSAKVGSIGDNRLGGWYSYRASKAALNQLVHTAAIELARQKPQAICVALHPGTVDTPLSSGFAKSGLEVQLPDEAAARLLAVIDGLRAKDTGGFFNHHGEPLPW
ncbi:MAG: C-factor [Burkholderiales bacterium PBB1]|nr:MAG: C-factor [Burkholderiales bacterium PBB1]